MNIVNVSHPDIMRKAGQQGTNTGVLYLPPTYKHRTVNKPAALSDNTQYCSFAIKNFVLNNRGSTSIVAGLGVRYRSDIWHAGRLNAAGTAYTDFTKDSQARVTAVTLGVDGADQTGFVILCREPFAWVSVDITTVESNAGGSTVVDHAVQYSNAAGTGWTTVSTSGIMTDDFTTTNTVWSATAHNFVWQPPSDWGKTSGYTSLENDYYALRFNAAEREASDVAAIATGIEIGTMVSFESVIANGIASGGPIDFYSPYANALVAYFSTADAGNSVYAELETR